MKTLCAMVQLPLVNVKKNSSILSSEKIRFVAVGAVNTTIDFAILFILSSFAGVSVFLANAISTSTALAVSYLLNKKAVFKNNDTTNMRQILLFVAITLVGLWVVQGIVIWLVSGMVQALLQLSDPVSLLIAKLIATLFSLTWNYLWYSRVVFPRRNVSEK